MTPQQFVAKWSKIQQKETALSVRQPYAELIMCGQKKFECRRVATRKKNEPWGS
jgi:hypothetical protein